MKYLKKILFALFIILTIPKVFASTSLSIDSKSYDETSNTFTVSGTSSYSDVMVSLFDGEELLSFKTVTSSNGEYTAVFNIAFNEDKTITIKVGDIKSTNYKMSTLNVKKSTLPAKSNKLSDEYGNSLTILDSLKKFELDDNLVIQIIDIDGLNEEDTAKFDAIREKYGLKREIFGIMLVMVVNGEEDVELTDLTDGYELFINMDEDALSDFAKPYMSRLLDEDTLDFEEGKKLEYNSDKEGYIVKLNNIGMYILYDDISVTYKFLDNTDNQTYNIKKDNTLTLKVDADYNKFTNVYMDGKLVDSKNYTSKSGSTIITFTKDYMRSLSVGTHNIKVDFNDGEANTTLTVNDGNPKTGDTILKYIFIILVCVLGICGVILYLRKRKKNN